MQSATHICLHGAGPYIELSLDGNTAQFYSLEMRRMMPSLEQYDYRTRAYAPLMVWEHFASLICRPTFGFSSHIRFFSIITGKILQSIEVPMLGAFQAAFNADWVLLYREPVVLSGAVRCRFVDNAISCQTVNSQSVLRFHSMKVYSF
jgi:hypothetical protein